IEMRGVTKRFGSLVANDRIDLEVGQGEVVALLGENGAGKTTLTKILFGMYQPEEGDIRIGGEPVRFQAPADAIAKGIGFVTQHFSLVPSFSVAENVVLGQEGLALLRREALEQAVAKTATRHGLRLDPAALVRDLSVGEQQRVEILKALYHDCRLLILDEPTAVLTPQDVDSLFAILRELQKRGLAVIIITHKLEEALSISQRVVVLRGGRVVGVKPTADTTSTELARLMVGRDSLPVTRNLDHRRDEAVVLQADRVRVVSKRGIEVLAGVSLDLHAGEIVGLAGVAGNGQSELLDVLTGMLEPTSGRVLLEGGRALRFENQRQLERLGIGRIPEDRLTGVVGELTVAENLTLEHLGHFSRRGHLAHRRMMEVAERLIDEYQIKAKPHHKARTLSGGNLQKLILARTLSREPQVVIAGQPTRGLDVGATEYVHYKLLEQKERGAGVLLVSEDLDEVLRLSDRVLVIYGGHLVGEFPADRLDVEAIGLLMAGADAPGGLRVEPPS
ncbi:MAG: ABC transporter ATP-binding protein, partial [Trueperaceae bacterium]